MAERAFSIPLLIKAGDSSGVADVSLTARHKDISQEQTVEIAVRPPYPRITRTGALSIKAGDGFHRASDGLVSRHAARRYIHVGLAFRFNRGRRQIPS